MRASLAGTAAVLGAWLAGTVAHGAGADVRLTNPTGRARQACATVPLSDVGLAPKTFSRPAGRTTDGKLAFQLDGNELTVEAKLDPFQAAALRLDPKGVGPAPKGIVLAEDDKALTVTTPLYTVVLDKTRGYQLGKIRDHKTRREVKLTGGGLVLTDEQERPKYTGTWFGAPNQYRQSVAKVQCEVLKRGPLVAQVQLSWSCRVGTVRQLITFSRTSRLVQYDCELCYTRPVVQVRFAMNCWALGTSQGEATIYPEGKRMGGAWGRGTCRPAPRYVFAHTKRKRIGMGLTSYDPGSDYFHFLIMGKREGFGGDRVMIDLFSRTLRWTPVPGTCPLRFAVIAGGTPREAAQCARDRLVPFTAGKVDAPFVASIVPQRHPLLVGRKNTVRVTLANPTQARVTSPVTVQAARAKLTQRNVSLEPGVTTTVDCAWTPERVHEAESTLTVTLGDRPCHYALDVARPVTIAKVWPDKLIHRLGESANTRVVLASHSDRAETVDMLSEVIAGTHERRQVDRRKVTLAPHQTKPIDVGWNAGQREYGLTFRVTLLDSGKVGDQKEEYTSATNFAPKVAQVGIMNPSCRQEGSAPFYMRMFRERYFGIVEYYCWAPDQVTDLTPDGDTWEPHTESQGAYRVTLTKKFLQMAVKEGHRHGIHMYAMDTGMISLPGVLAHPELVKYTEDGQPYMYNGRVYDGKHRFSVGSVDIYSDDKVRRWGEEMAASVDMFGWDGVRWDWGFVPTAPPDPLAGDEAQKAKFGGSEAPPWYNHKGVCVTKLFPDPDAVGARLLRLWRQTVNKRHPNFVYGTNFSATPERLRCSPKYFKEASTHSLVLFEFLLGSCHERYGTWAKWAKALTETCQRVRLHGAQPNIGYMRGYAAGGTALRLSQYLMFAAGVHWGGGAGPRHGLDDTWKRFRFALRFAEYCYDPRFRLLAPERRKEVNVTGAKRVFWEQFVYERPTPTGRDVTVHLLNLPKSDYIIMHHERPSPKRNITVTVTLKSGEKLEGAWIMRPDPLPNAVAAKTQTDGHKVRIRVPELTEAAIVLAEVTR